MNTQFEFLRLHFNFNCQISGIHVARGHILIFGIWRDILMFQSQFGGWCRDSTDVMGVNINNVVTFEISLPSARPLDTVRWCKWHIWPKENPIRTKLNFNPRRHIELFVLISNISRRGASPGHRENSIYNFISTETFRNIKIFFSA